MTEFITEEEFSKANQGFSGWSSSPVNGLRIYSYDDISYLHFEDYESLYMKSDNADDSIWVVGVCKKYPNDYVKYIKRRFVLENL